MNIPKGFTQSAMKALVQAQICAAAMGQERMGTGHIVVGLCKGSDELTQCIVGDLSVQEIEREMVPKTVMEKPKPDPRKVSMLRMKIRENTTLQEARLELEELTSIVSRADGAMVSVYGKVCPGTVIRIDDVLLNVREEQFAVQFIKHVDKIHMERIVDSVF